MVSAIGLYWVLKIFLARPRPSLGSDAMSAGALFIALAIVCYAGAWWWFRRGVDAVTRPGRATEETPGHLLMQVQSTVIVCLALLEAPVVMGLAHAMVGSGWPYLFEGFATASLIGMLVLRFQGLPAVFGAINRMTGS